MTPAPKTDVMSHDEPIEITLLESKKNGWSKVKNKCDIAVCGDLLREGAPLTSQY
jgi:hypothetical protein